MKGRQTADEDILRRINRGDMNAFRQFYKKHYVFLCTMATKYVYDPEAAREIVNDVFLNVWHNRTSLSHPAMAYFVKAIRNRSLNYIRQKKNQELPLSQVQEELLKIQEEALATEEHPLACLENQELEKHVAEAIEILPEKCKTIFKQYLYRHKTYEEIAQLNNINPSTVRGQIRIGVSRIKRLLKRYYDNTLF